MKDKKKEEILKKSFLLSKQISETLDSKTEHISSVRYYEDFFEDFDRKYFQDLIGKFGLEEGMKAKDMSTGMSAKLKIAATLARKSELCMLDEPLNGVDYKAREEIIALILEEADDKRTFLLSTHLIDEIESFVEKAFFIKSGELIKGMDLEAERMASGRSLTDVYMDIM